MLLCIGVVVFAAFLPIVLAPRRRDSDAVVDEADSILRDEARVPLVIAGSVGRESSSTRRLAELVATLVPGVHFDADEYGR